MRDPDDEVELDEAHRQLLRTGQQHRRLAISDAQRRHHEAVAGLGTSVQRLSVRLILKLEDPGEICSPGSSAFWWSVSGGGASG
jgi:hypothetical protein